MEQLVLTLSLNPEAHPNMTNDIQFILLRLNWFTFFYIYHPRSLLIKMEVTSANFS